MYDRIYKKEGSFRKAAKQLGLTKSKFVRLWKIELGLCQRRTSCKNLPEKEKTACRSCLNYVKNTQNQDQKKLSNQKWREENKDYIKLKTKAYQQENLNKWKDYRKKYYETDKGKLSEQRRRQRRRQFEDFVMSEFDLRFLKSNFGVCAKTGIQANLTLDHHIPLSKGGQLTIDNAVFLCSQANSSKRDLLPEDFYTKTQLEMIESYFKKVNEYKTVSSPTEYEIVEEEDTQACANFIKTYHYLGTCTRVKHAFALRYKDRVLGVCIFTNTTTKGVLELSRLYIVDGTPKNTESYFVSKCLKLLKKDYKKIISYADPQRGHKGTIYKASNFNFEGETPGSGYFYTNSEGEYFNKRTVYYHAKKLNLTEKEYVNLEEMIKIKSPKKLKFSYSF